MEGGSSSGMCISMEGMGNLVHGGYLVIICVRWEDIPEYVLDTPVGSERGLTTTPCLIILPKKETKYS